jgi:subtilase family serine protease
MLLRSALRLRPAISSALLASLLVAVPAAAHAQAASNAIASLHPAAQHDRISAHPDFTPLTQLSHQLPGWMQGRPQSSAHAVDLSTPISVSLVLNRDPSVEAAFDQFLADQQNPSSPLYHQWLTPQQVGTLFGPTANDLAALTTWLTSQGLKVDSIAPSGVIVHASGSAAIVGNAFHTTFAMFSPDEGLTAAPRLSAVSEPSIPSALTPLVRSIAGLGELELRPLHQARAVRGTPRPAAANTPSSVQPLFSNGPAPDSYFLTPGDMAIIFDINSVYSGGNKGATIGSKAQRIAVIGESRVTNTDITEFEGYTGLASYTPTVVIPPTGLDPGTTANGFQSEATLDVDRVIGTAPGAGVDLVVSKDTTTNSGIFIAIEYNIETLLDPVMTISYGGCESSNGLANTNFVDNLAKNGAAEGITTLVSSGDSGAAGCDTSFVKAPVTQIASINFICSSTYVTCVGGTEFNDTANPSTYWSTTNNSTNLASALSYIPEGGWNEPTDPTSTTTPFPVAASGGGVSTFIPKPTWQTGTGVPSGNFRFTPDVSLPASGHDGYFACLAGYGGGDCSQGYFEVFSGTSAAAPGIAGIVALINTKVGTAAGNINPMLYALASSTPSAFHDITVTTSGVTGCVATTPSMCNNSTPGPTTLTGGLSGYLLTTGYDEVTGLGSVDVATLVANATAPTGGGGGTASFTLSASPTTLSGTPTASTNGTPITGTATSTITVTSTNSFASAVALTCAITPTVTGPPTCAVSPTSATPTANGTATSNAGSTSSTIHIAYFGPAALAFMLLLLPFRKRKSMRNLACVVLLASGLASLSGCGGNSTGGGGGGACSNVVSAGTTPGSYTVTVTGTSGSITQTATVALTIN